MVIAVRRMRTEAVRHWRTKASRRACGGWREPATKAAGGRVSVEHKSAVAAPPAEGKRASELSAKTEAERGAQSPLGDGRGDEHRGDGRGPGERRPDQNSKTAERRRWREGCRQAGALTARTNARCGIAVSVTVQQRDSTQRHIVRHLLPAQGLGVPCASGINDRRVTHNMCCVRSRKHSCMPTSPRSSRNLLGRLDSLPHLFRRPGESAERDDGRFRESGQNANGRP